MMEDDWRIEVGARALYRVVNQRTPPSRQTPWEKISIMRKMEYREEAAAVIEAVLVSEEKRS
jgi:hypothetical protein